MSLKLRLLTTGAAVLAAGSVLAGPANAIPAPNQVKTTAFICVKDGPAKVLKCGKFRIISAPAQGKSVTLESHVTAAHFTGTVTYQVSRDQFKQASFRITRVRLRSLNKDFVSPKAHTTKFLKPLVRASDTEVFNDPRKNGSRVSVSLGVIDLDPGKVGV